jgi:hypothetical protein
MSRDSKSIYTIGDLSAAMYEFTIRDEITNLTAAAATLLKLINYQ